MPDELGYDPTDPYGIKKELQKQREQEEKRKTLERSVSELELSVRAANCLKAAKIKTIADLVQRSDGEMLQYHNFGKKSLQEIKEILDGMGLSLGMNVEDYIAGTTEEQ